MKIKLLTVSCFLITTDRGVRIITDPYWHNYIPDNPPPGQTEHPPIAELADVVTMTHEHFNDSYIWAIKGVPQLYTGGAPAEIKGVRFVGVVGRHIGNNQCLNTIIMIEADGICMVHMGDFGQNRLYDEQLAKIGRVDILMTRWSDMPVILDQLRPKVVLPMKNAREDDYMTGLRGFIRLDNTSELEFRAEALPSEMKVMMLTPSLGVGDG
jgi:L-ascorbate metabolism protein UlaG (beta-lactamase superfamily)